MGADQAPRHAQAPSRSVRTAILAGVAFAVVAVLALIAGPTAFFALCLLILIGAQAELYAALRSAGHHPATLLGLVCGVVLLVGAYAWGLVALPLLTVLPVALAVLWLLTVPAERARSSVGSTLLGVVYGPLLASFAVLLLREPNGIFLVAAFVGMVAVFDAGAYLGGRKIGRHRMSRISPNKTWEGLAAGVVVCLAVSAVIGPLLPGLDLWTSLRLALVMCLVAPVGDLAESLVKRDLGVKDMGSILPGHGGLFDRLDAILFAAPAAYLVLTVTGAVS